MVITGKVICLAVMANTALFSRAGTNSACRYSNIVVEASSKYKLDPTY